MRWNTLSRQQKVSGTSVGVALPYFATNTRFLSVLSKEALIFWVTFDIFSIKRPGNSIALGL